MEALLGVPLATRCILVVCVAVHMYFFLFGGGVGGVCLAVQRVTEGREAWRLFTSVWVHGGVLHLVFNMMALASALGPRLEKDVFGTARFLALNLFLIPLTTICQCLLLLAGSTLFDMPGLLTECSVGYSGVLFSLIVLRCHLLDSSLPLPVIGKVSSRFYPLLSILFIQLLMPRASFAGHLSGCVVGYAVAYWQSTACGTLLEHVASLEDKSWMDAICRLQGYYRIPSDSLPTTAARSISGPAAAVSGSLLTQKVLTPGGSAPVADGDGKFPGIGRSLKEEGPPKSAEASSLATNAVLV